jgi:DNA-binding transcriptional regulator YiaG
MSESLKYVQTQVNIPNLDGDGIAEVVTITIPVTTDPDGGEEMLTTEAIELIENTKARHMGLMLPAEIKALRQRLGLTQRDISELLQAGEKSYTRWESGRLRPSRMVNVVLRALHEGKLTVEYLRSQRRTSFDWRNVVEFDFGQNRRNRLVWISAKNANGGREVAEVTNEERLVAA